MLNVLSLFRSGSILHRKTIMIELSFCLFFVSGIHAQLLPKKPTPQQFAGYHMKQQQIWQQQQLPRNSVTYQFGTTANTSPLNNFNLKKEKPVATVILSANHNLLLNTKRTTASPSLHLYLMQDRQQMNKDLKQGWWKDPAQAPGAEFFRTMFMTNKNNWLYNSMSTSKK